MSRPTAEHNPFGDCPPELSTYLQNVGNYPAAMLCLLAHVRRPNEKLWAIDIEEELGRMHPAEPLLEYSVLCTARQRLESIKWLNTEGERKNTRRTQVSETGETWGMWMIGAVAGWHLDYPQYSRRIINPRLKFTHMRLGLLRLLLEERELERPHTVMMSMGYNETSAAEDRRYLEQAGVISITYTNKTMRTKNGPRNIIGSIALTPDAYVPADELVARTFGLRHAPMRTAATERALDIMDSSEDLGELMKLRKA